MNVANILKKADNSSSFADENFQRNWTNGAIYDMLNMVGDECEKHPDFYN